MPQSTDLCRRDLLCLIGFMGAGKTAVGHSLAERLRLPFLDLDDVIAEMTGKDVPTIFRESGETGFRAVESEALRQVLAAGGPRVLSLGGGTFQGPENRASILDSGACTIYLKVTLEEAVRRCTAQRVKRPLLEGADRAKLQQLYLERQSAYSLAGWHIETSGKPVNEVTDEVLALIARKPFGQEAKL